VHFIIANLLVDTYNYIKIIKLQIYAISLETSQFELVAKFSKFICLVASTTSVLDSGEQIHKLRINQSSSSIVCHSFV